MSRKQINFLNHCTGWFISEANKHFAENFSVMVIEPVHADIDTVMKPKPEPPEHYFLIGDSYIAEFETWCKANFTNAEIIWGEGTTR